VEDGGGLRVERWIVFPDQIAIAEHIDAARGQLPIGTKRRLVAGCIVSIMNANGILGYSPVAYGELTQQSVGVGLTGSE